MKKTEELKLKAISLVAKELSMKENDPLLNTNKSIIQKVDEKFAELILEDVIHLMRQEWYDLNSIQKVEGETARDVGMRVGKKSQTIVLLEKVKKHFQLKDRN